MSELELLPLEEPPPPTRRRRVGAPRRRRRTSRASSCGAGPALEPGPLLALAVGAGTELALLAPEAGFGPALIALAGWTTVWLVVAFTTSALLGTTLLRTSFGDLRNAAVKFAAIALLPHAVLHLAALAGGPLALYVAVIPAALVAWHLLCRFFGLTVQVAVFFGLVCELVALVLVGPALRALFGG